MKARIVDETKRGIFAWVSRESHTPKTSDVGAIFAKGSASPRSAEKKGLVQLVLQVGAANKRIARAVASFKQVDLFLACIDDNLGHEILYTGCA